MLAAPQVNGRICSAGSRSACQVLQQSIMVAFFWLQV